MEEKPREPSAKLPENEEEQEKVIKLLEERLEKHDNGRKAVQGKLTEISNKLKVQADELEDRVNKELEEKFTSEEDRLQRALNKLRVSNTDSAFQEAKRELSVIQSYEIIENKKPNNDITTLYELNPERRVVHEDGSAGLAIPEANSSTNGPSNVTEMSETSCDSVKLAEERERLIELLKERLQTHDNNKKAVQDKLHDICERLRAQICELEDKINKELEEKIIFEDNRLQAALNELRGNRTASALQKAKAELFVEQSYEIIENNFGSKHYLTTLYKLKAERRIVPELIEMRKPTNVRVAGVNRGCVSVEFTCLNPDEERVFSDRTIVNPVKYKCMLFNKGNEQENKDYPLNKNEGNGSSSSSCFTFTPDFLGAETTYGVRVKMVVGDSEYGWRDEVAEFTTPEFKECCIWKKRPDYVHAYMKYSVDEKNPRVTAKIEGIGWCTIIGNTLIPLNKVTSWNVKILKSRNNDGHGIWIGIAPNDINQDTDNFYGGWYFHCYYSWLDSGPPHSYSAKKYGPRKEEGQYVHTGDSVGVVMDTTRGDLSFVLNGVNLGVAFKGIPLDKPLIPSVVIYKHFDSVELII